MQEIINVDSHNTAKENYKNFAYYANATRALASDVDGMKTVYRRMLWTAMQYPKGKFIKSAVISGECMKIHPHGEQCGVLYSLVNSKLNIFDKQGNFGSALIPGSAPRYTECRYNRLAELYLGQDLLNHCEMVEGDIGYMEPKYLPALIPFILVDGNSSMGIGISSSIPSLDVLDLIKFFKSALEDKDYEEMKLDLGLCGIGSSIKDISRSCLSGAIRGFRFNPVVTIEDRSSLVITCIPEGMKFDKIYKIFEDGINKDQIDFRDESSSSLRLVFEIHKGNIEEYKSRVEKLSSTVSYDIVVSTDDNHIRYTDLYYLREKTINYLRSCCTRKFSTELAKLNKSLEISKIIHYMKENGIVKKLTDLSKEELIKMLPFREESINHTLQLPITKLMKGSTDEDMKRLEDAINKTQYLLDNPNVYLLNLYNKFEEEISKSYKNLTVYSEVYNSDSWFYSLRDKKLEIINRSNDGYTKLDPGRYYACKEDGQVEVIELNSPIVMNDVVGFEKVEDGVVYALLGKNDKEIMTITSDIVLMSRKVVKGEVSLFKKLQNKEFVPCEKGDCPTFWMMASSRVTKFKIIGWEGKVLIDKI